ncbi:MAG TPA: T9SS type A sorting domain-containing protein [Bacteroidales bacterium]|nr:T9SS type A sorting domain-containing protein [Bacteroidales bacterium]HRX97513.1 T9SS type A sorting domain-containing protein [Bacteroidales bacterium]
MVYPNPTNGYLIVAYDLEGKQTGTIEISDMTGKLMDKRVVNQTKDQLTFVVKEWKTGTYIVSLKNDGKLIESCKFTVVN